MGKNVMTDNAGLRGARLMASEQAASAARVRIPSADGITMGNVAPLKKRIKELEQQIASLQKQLDNNRWREELRPETDSWGNFTGRYYT